MTGTSEWIKFFKRTKRLARRAQGFAKVTLLEEDLMKVRCFLGLFIGATGIACLSSDVQAGPFRNARQPVRTQSNATVHAAQAVVHQASAGVAQGKAEMQSRQGTMRHVGGSMGAGRYEGVGFSSVSADDAVRRCCYWGQKTPIEIGVSRGANGWYATVIYQ